MSKKTVLQITFLFTAIVAHAQIPDFLPSGDTEPLELTTFNIVLYIVIPVALFIFYLWYRKSKRKKKNNTDNNK